MTFLPMGGRPAWMNHLLWQAIQLEAAPVDTGHLIDIFLAAQHQLDASHPCRAPEVVEIKIGQFHPVAECEFYDLVFAVWLTARRARIANAAHHPELVATAIADGATLLLLANGRRGATADYLRTLSRPRKPNRSQPAASHV